MKKSLAIAYNMKKKSKKMAPMPSKEMTEDAEMLASQGADQMEPEQPAQPKMMAKGGALVDKIMSKRMNKDCYSEGGKVANDTVHDDEIDQYDDLVLRDDLSGEQPEDSNEHGDAEHDHENADMVSKIMMSRRKKDKLPNPR